MRLVKKKEILIGIAVLLLGLVIYYLFTYPMLKISNEISNVAIELKVFNKKIELIFQADGQFENAEENFLNLDKSLNVLNNNIADLSKKLDFTNKEFSSLNERVQGSKLLGI
jgi:peptidoglycan hydrolase CwlO-like protein